MMSSSSLYNIALDATAKFHVFSIGIEWISNDVLVSGAQELDSVIYRHTSILLSHIDYHSVFS